MSVLTSTASTKSLGRASESRCPSSQMTLSRPPGDHSELLLTLPSGSSKPKLLEVRFTRPSPSSCSNSSSNYWCQHQNQELDLGLGLGLDVDLLQQQKQQEDRNLTLKISRRHQPSHSNPLLPSDTPPQHSSGSDLCIRWPLQACHQARQTFRSRRRRGHGPSEAPDSVVWFRHSRCAR
jgi:hypothetical protein